MSSRISRRVISWNAISAKLRVLVVFLFVKLYKFHNTNVINYVKIKNNIKI